MDLDIFDAIRLHRVVNFDVDGERYTVEPYDIRPLGNEVSLRAFVVRGPLDGWAEFARWTKLDFTRETFSPRPDQPGG
jgi:hypothetical protein